MPDTKEPRWSFSATQIVVGVLAVISMTLGTWKSISEKADKAEVQVKADKKDLDSLALTVSTLASKKEVEGLVSAVSALTKELNELSARQREGVVTLDYIKSIAEKTDSRIGKMEDNQNWQIQQEAKRIQWQNFKQEPPAVPPANVKQ